MPQAPIAKVRRECQGSTLVMDKGWVEGNLNSIGALAVPLPRVLRTKAGPQKNMNQG